MSRPGTTQHLLFLVLVYTPRAVSGLRGRSMDIDSSKQISSKQISIRSFLSRAGEYKNVAPPRHSLMQFISPLANGAHTDRGDDLAAIAAAATATPEVFLAGVARMRTVSRPIITGPCLPLVEGNFGYAKCTLGSTWSCIPAPSSKLQVDPIVSNSLPLSSTITGGIGVVLSLNNYSLRTAGLLSQNRTYLATKYGDKDEVKSLGARWDPEARRWYVTPAVDLSAFSRWLPKLDAQNRALGHAAIGIVGSCADGTWEVAELKENSGALRKDTREYTLPGEAERTMEFVCIECGEKVILKRGDIRRPHFAHYHNSSHNPCTYFTHPSESQIHKDAKHKLALFLRQRRAINILWQCPNKEKRSWCKWSGSTRVKYQEDDRVVVEYRDPAGRFVADVALLNGKRVKYIFEFKHTHSTMEGTRPEPWFEIKVGDFPMSNDTELVLETQNWDKRCSVRRDFESELEGFFTGNSIDLECIRSTSIRSCSECLFYMSPPTWTVNIPRLPRRVGQEGLWEQAGPCKICGRPRYSPAFLNGHRQVCKICLNENRDKVKAICALARSNCL